MTAANHSGDHTLNPAVVKTSVVLLTGADSGYPPGQPPQPCSRAPIPFRSSVSDRLKDLQRQHALAREQLAWLEREIARESGQSPPLAAPLPLTPGPQPRVVPPEPPTASQAAADAEAILAQYRPAPEAVQKNVKLGCFLYFFGALGLLLLGVLAVYLLRAPK